MAERTASRGPVLYIETVLHTTLQPLTDSDGDAAADETDVEVVDRHRVRFKRRPLATTIERDSLYNKRQKLPNGCYVADKKANNDDDKNADEELDDGEGDGDDGGDGRLERLERALDTARKELEQRQKKDVADSRILINKWACIICGSHTVHLTHFTAHCTSHLVSTRLYTRLYTRLCPSCLPP
jgi:hypothetical protein